MIEREAVSEKIQTAEICYEGVCRPGGFSITDRAMNYCAFKKDAKLLDIGCGLGGTIRHLRKEYGLSAVGVDKDMLIVDRGRGLLRESMEASGLESIAAEVKRTLVVGDSERLDFIDGELDGVILECSFSKMDQEHSVLKEAFRVLKAEGYLIISDFYSRGLPAVLAGLLGRVDLKEQLLEKFEKNHFRIELFEDYTKEMKNMLGQMLLDHGCKNLYESIGASAEEIKKIKLGYCLIIARKL